MRLIGRRNFVEGFGLGAAATLLTPFARSMVREAQGAEGKPRAIVSISSLGFGHGEAGRSSIVERWVPSNRDLTAEGALPPSLEPLRPWASRMLILDYFWNPFNPGQHSNGWASLAMQGTRPSGGVSGGQQSEQVYPTPKGITFDIFLGERLSRGLPFRTINIATDTSGFSVDANDNPVPSFRNAATAFSQVFGNFAGPTGTVDVKARLAEKKSVLDLALGDLNRLRSRLASVERAKLDQMEGSIRALEAQLASFLVVPTSACKVPEKPTTDTGSGPHGGPLPVGYLPTMTLIQTTALICRLTNVVVPKLTPQRRTYQLIFGHRDDKHNTSHAFHTAPLQKIDAYEAGLLGKMLSALERVPEGNGTMADRTLAVWVNDGGGLHHAPRSVRDNHPVIVIGKLGGLRGGRHVTWPRSERRALSDAFVSIQHALGIQQDTFGDASVCKGPLPGLT